MSRPRQETERLVRLTSRRWGGKHRWYCLYCGRRASQVDHFFPESTGGSSKPMNLVPACPTCNKHKMDREPMAWLKAVGVPIKRREWLWKVVHNPEFRILLEPPPHVWTLNYPAGNLIPRPERPKRASSGQKGK